MKVGLISCGKNKAEQNNLAKDLYTGDLFRKARRYAEVKYDAYFILSALHGLVHPDTELEPYDFTLNAQNKDFKREWSRKVASDIASALPTGTEIFIHAGREYRDFLIPELVSKGFACFVPLEGLGIGQQLGFYKKALSK